MANRVSARREGMRRLIAEQESSGASAARFARERGMTPWSFYKWKRRLAGQAAEAAGSAASGFVEVKIVSGPREAAIAVELLSGVRLTVPRGFEEEHLRRLIGVLRSCRACLRR